MPFPSQRTPSQTPIAYNLSANDSCSSPTHKINARTAHYHWKWNDFVWHILFDNVTWCITIKEYNKVSKRCIHLVGITRKTLQEMDDMELWQHKDTEPKWLPTLLLTLAHQQASSLISSDLISMRPKPHRLSNISKHHPPPPHIQ